MRKYPFKNATEDSTQTTTKTVPKMNSEFSNATAVEIREISNTTDPLTTNTSREEPVFTNENDQVRTPAGITSFPWKFAIPRPAQPRRLALPPRPSEMS
ncbi:hypothetical protein CEXT_769841 [Caerostris extrusa]|uniref:Uncharacterized protein n=1 Tax=Caerostris extrusa TaxID=172846 RepID=A0AAV4YCU2_CAEEX|nr:hypothetical protein CEXT_769841 [Caerostris extrusa]